jgi:hypothetical protein
LEGWHLNKLVLILVLVVLAGVAAHYAGFFSSGGAGTALNALFSQRNAFLDAAAAKAEAYGAQYSQDFLSYTQPEYGYTVNYPKGYLALADPIEDVSFRAAANTPISYAEVIDVRVSERDFTQKDFEEVLSGFTKDELVSQYSGVINGKKVFVYTTKGTFPIAKESIFLRTAVYPECKANDGTRYTGVIIAAISGTLAQDLDLADYVIYSFKC